MGGLALATLANFPRQYSPYHVWSLLGYICLGSRGRKKMPGTQDWEDGMLAYLPIMTIALLAMTAISIATVGLAMVADHYIEIDSFSFGPR